MRNILISFLLCVCSSCGYNAGTKETLKLAGENRKELEKALHHYTNDQDKTKAVEYLLSNMSNKFAYTGELLEQYDYLLSVYDSLYKKKIYVGDPPIIHQTWDSLVAQYGPLDISRLDSTYDCRILSSDFLINNVDIAFEAWQQKPDYVADDFESFCEYVLPYRVGDETVEQYRRNYFDKYRSLVDSAGTDPLKLLSLFNVEFSWKQWYRTAGKMWEYPVALPISKMELCHRGSCRQLCVYCALVMRACGLPVAIDRVNSWGNRGQGHEWNVLLLKDSILPFDSFAKDRIKFAYKPTKIFRSTFSNNHLPDDAPINGEVPSNLINPNEIDVTEQYGKVYDINIGCTFPDVRLKPNKYGVICVFDNKQWTPVYWGILKENQMTFRKMMGDVCYMAAYYEDEKIHPASEPFILEKDGSIRYLKVNKQKPVTMKLKRKYPRFERMDKLAYQLLSTSVRGTNRADLEEADRLFKIKKIPVDISDTIISVDKKFRYVYIDIVTYRTGDLAEIEFYGKKNQKDEEHKLEGKIIGLSGDGSDSYTLAMDGDYNTYFSKAKDARGYVGLDLGPKGRSYITRVRLAPRSDSNFILKNNIYELCYWDGRKWASMGKKVASDVAITFEHVPSGTCYILHNLSAGKEERIFTYEDGEQVWW